MWAAPFFSFRLCEPAEAELLLSDCNSALAVYRTRLVAPLIHDTEKAEWLAAPRRQPMGLIRANVDGVEGRDAMLPRTHPYLSESAHADYDMTMTVTLEAGESAGLELEISQLESEPLAAPAGQHLARGPRKFTAAMGAQFVRFELDRVPSKVAPEAPHDGRGGRFERERRRFAPLPAAGHGVAALLGLRHRGYAPKVTTTLSASGFWATANASLMRSSGKRCVTRSAARITPRSTSDRAWRVSSGPQE